MGKGPSTKKSSTKAKDVNWEIDEAKNPKLVEMAAVGILTYIDKSASARIPL
jgi:hypothetical protein